MNILAIDDCGVIAEGYKFRFGAKSFTEYMDFIEELRKERPDLLILDLDIGLPRVNGWTITEEARKLYPDVPIIIATGHDDDTQKAMAELMQVDFCAKNGLVGITNLRELVTKYGSPDRPGD